jgi:hypothetical protein
MRQSKARVGKERDHGDKEGQEPPMALVEFMRPTQGAVGFLEVAFKMAELRERSLDSKNLERYLLGHPIPAVVGPDGRMYLTDHHHMGLALQSLAREWELGDGGAGLNPFRACYFEVVADCSQTPQMSLRSFHLALEARGLCHPKGGDGRRLDALPRTLSELEDDPYRSLAGLARKAGAYDKVKTPYVEFKWADFLRDKVAASLIARETLPEAIRLATELAASPAAAGLPGYKNPAPTLASLPTVADISARLAKRHGSDDKALELPATLSPAS